MRSAWMSLVFALVVFLGANGLGVAFVEASDLDRELGYINSLRSSEAIDLSFSSSLPDLEETPVFEETSTPAEPVREEPTPMVPLVDRY